MTCSGTHRWLVAEPRSNTGCLPLGSVRVPTGHPTFPKKPCYWRQESLDGLSVEVERDSHGQIRGVEGLLSRHCRGRTADRCHGEAGGREAAGATAAQVVMTRPPPGQWPREWTEGKGVRNGSGIDYSFGHRNGGKRAMKLEHQARSPWIT